MRREDVGKEREREEAQNHYKHKGTVARSDGANAVAQATVREWNWKLSLAQPYQLFKPSIIRHHCLGILGILGTFGCTVRETSKQFLLKLTTVLPYYLTTFLPTLPYYQRI